MNLFQISSKMEKALFLGLILTASMSFTSCDEDEWSEKVEVSYVAACSEDLLKFVTPVITYTDGNLKQQKVTMSSTVWTQKADYSIEGASELPSLTFTGEMTFERKAMPDTIGKTFTFYHDVEAVAVTTARFHEAGTWGGWLSNGSETLYVDKEDGSLSNVTYTVSGAAIDYYLNRITGEPSYVTMTIGPKGEITKKNNKIQIITRTE